MYSARSRTKFTTGSVNSSAIKSCQLCFSVYEEEEEIGLGYNSKIPHLSFKYLHSSLTEELSIESDDQQFCPKCSMRGTELLGLSEQMEFIQKSLSELVFIFSLEILHRRGKTTKRPNSPRMNLVEFDVSALPNCESWNNSPPDFDASAASQKQNIIPENVGIQNSEAQILYPVFVDHREDHNDILIPEVKHEIMGNSTEIWNEEVANNSGNTEEMETYDSTPHLAETEFLTNNTTASVKPVQNNGIDTCSYNQLLNPTVRLQKLEIDHRVGEQIIAEENTDDFVFNKNQLGEIRETVWTEEDPGRSSFELIQQNSEFSNQERIGQLNWLSLNPISSEAAIPSKKCVSSSLCKNISKAINENPSREKRLKVTSGFGKKTFKKPPGGGIAQQRSDNGRKPYQCLLCPKSFVKSRTLLYHDRQQHSKLKLLKCTYCPKGFAENRDFVRHVRTHTGEKPYSCDKCDYSAAVPWGLKSHKIKHHGNKGPGIKMCRECGNEFKSAGDVKQHFKRIHFALEFSDDCVIQMD